MNRSHNSLANALEIMRHDLMAVPGCNDRGNNVETFLCTSINIATDVAYTESPQFLLHSYNGPGRDTNPKMIFIRQICCRTWRILIIYFKKELAGVDNYAFRHGEDPDDEFDKKLACRYPERATPVGGFTEEPPLYQLSFWHPLQNMPTSQPENQPQWPDHNVHIHDLCGSIYNRMNPSYPYLRTQGLIFGKAYGTPTDEAPSKGDPADFSPAQCYDIIANKMACLRLSESAIGTEMFYIFVQPTEKSMQWENAWYYKDLSLGSQGQYCLRCNVFDPSPGDGSHHFTTKHLKHLTNHMETGGTSIV